MRRNTIIVIILLLASSLFAQADLNNILNGIFRKQDKMDSEIRDAIFDGDYSYLEKNDKGNITKTFTTKRTVYSKSYDKQKSVYSEVTENGRVLSETEKNKVLKQNRGDVQTKLPFASRYRNLYQFSYLGEENFNGMPIWKISYEPNKKGKDFIQGFAYVLKSDTNVIQYQFTPVGLPFVLKNFNIILDYTKLNNYWVPRQFSLKMEIDVKVIFSLSHKFIEMQETYSNYRFNIGLDDSFFVNK